MTDIEKYDNDSNDIVAAGPMTSVSQDVMQQLQNYVTAWESAAKIATHLAKTDFAGPFKGKPQDMAVAILKGASLGIPPETIGKAIYVVHGTPALYGKTALSIALQHGYVAETVEDTPQAVTVRMTSPKGQEMEVRYTIERATKEGLVKGNKLQYETRPSKMLYWKCIGELTDRMIPHLTGGMPIKEDVEQSRPPMKATAKRMDRGRGAAGLKQALEAGENTGPSQDILDSINEAESLEDLQDIMSAITDQPNWDAYVEAANHRNAELEQQ